VTVLEFAITNARPLEVAVAPAIALELAVAGGPIHSAMLACQIAIEPSLRAYGDSERARLSELFAGGAAPRALIWTHATVVVPAFDRETRLDLVLPCPLDFSHAAAKYFDGVRDGHIPIVVQLSGSIFRPGPGGRLEVAPIPRDREARYLLPVAVWRAAVERHYPDHAPLSLPRALVDQLHAYRRQRGFATLDQAIDALLTGGRA
jgi:hypothetical protein